MSIEFIATSANPQSVTKAERVNGQGAGATGDAAKAPDGGGFASVLSSVESEAPVAEKGTDSADSSGQVDTKVSEDEKEKTTVSPSPDASLLMAHSLPGDVAMLLAQAAHVAGKQTATMSDARQVGAKGIVAFTESASNEKLGSAGKVADAWLAQSTTDLSSTSPQTRSTQLQSAATANLAEARLLNRAAQMDMSAREPALSVGLIASGMADGFVRQADKDLGKPSSSSAVSGAEGAWGQHTLNAGNQVDAPSVIADPSMISQEQMVADTVGYWVSQGIQKAELKLDGFGSEPVQVSISLKGDEAHIGFRTDQSEIRQILEGATAHLKDLLSSEGLVLSGVSVGTSGQDGSAGSEERRNQQSARQATVVTMDAAPTQVRQPLSQSVGRALDLFV